MAVSLFFNSYSGGWSPNWVTRHVAHLRPIVPTPDDCEHLEFGGMKIGRGNRSIRRKPALAPLGREPGPPRWEASD
jgi:hypothetical protein